MSKLTVFIPAFFIAVLAFSDDEGMVKSWEGSLQLFGNEPFTQVALITDDQERWFLDMDEQELNHLWSENRGRIRITGTPIKKQFQGETRNFIKVKKYKWIDNDVY